MLGVVTLAIFTDMLLYGVIVPILPSYAAEMGVSEWAIGLLFGSYSLGLLVTTPLLGGLTDRVGRRGPMLGGVVALFFATLLFAVASNFPLLVAARLLQGAAAAAPWIAGLALVADIYPEQSRGRAMGIALSGMTGGVLIGPPLGGYLYEWGGYHLPFLVAAAIVVLDALVILLLLVEPPRKSTARQPLRGLLRDRGILVASGAVVIAAAAWGLLEPTLPLYLESTYHVSPGVIGLIFGLATLVFGIATPMVGAMADRLGRRRTMVLGIVALALSLQGVGLAPALVLVVAAVLVVSVAYGLALSPTLPELAAVVDRHGGGAYGAAYALFNAAYALGMMAGPIVGGALVDLFDFPAAMTLMGLAVLAYVPILLWLGQPHATIGVPSGMAATSRSASGAEEP
jgi:multidrug resistance protein